MKEKIYPNEFNNTIQINEDTGYPYPPKDVAKELIEKCLEDDRHNVESAYSHAKWVAELYEGQTGRYNTSWYWRKVKEFVMDMTPKFNNERNYKTIVDKENL
jgi:hypothetical protein